MLAAARDRGRWADPHDPNVNAVGRLFGNFIKYYIHFFSIIKSTNNEKSMYI